jgi:hypothetical protein
LPKRTRNILIAAVILLLLAVLLIVLPGKSKAFFLGLLFIAGFIALFGGLILFFSYLNEVVFPRPRNPTHVCHHCLALYQDPEEDVCAYCQEEFGLLNPLHSLSVFLADNTVDDLQARLDDLQEKMKTARGRNILYIEHDMKMGRRLLRMKQQ